LLFYLLVGASIAEVDSLEQASGMVLVANDLASQLKATKKQGKDTLAAYMRNVRLSLLAKAKRIILESSA
jgi:citrate lyase beta subunit